MNRVSIAEFCENINGFKLYPKQKEILETFYESGKRELVAILGRRSGKDTLCGIMALYEIYRLLQVENLFEYYNIAPGQPVYVMLVSTSSEQSRIIYDYFKSFMMASSYFRDQIGFASPDSIHFLTSEDKLLQEKLRKDGLDNAALKVKGSVIFMCAGSDSKGLLGKRIFSLILNEASSYRHVDRIYSALGPATSDFYHVGNKLDSHIITISSAGEKENKVCELMFSPHENRMTFQLATWEVNPHFSRDILRKEHNFLSDEDFDYEFGAVFKSVKIGYNQTVSLRLSINQTETLKKMARQQSHKTNTDISYVDLIRDSIKLYIQSRA